VEGAAADRTLEKLRVSNADAANDKNVFFVNIEMKCPLLFGILLILSVNC